MEDRLKRRADENEEQYLWRLAQMKESGEEDLDWRQIADLMNKEFRADESLYRDESAYRKPVQYAQRFMNAGVFDQENSETRLSELKDKTLELKKLKQEISDERRDYQRTVREESRNNSMADLIRGIIRETVEPYEPQKGEKRFTGLENGEEEMVVCLSDIHAGIEVDNAFNVYNQQEVHNRLNRYANAIEEITCRHPGISTCHIALGGDNISGAIHQNLRLENNENVVRQVKLVSLAIADFVNKISSLFNNVYVYSVSGNHSRIFPNKKDHLTGEELDDLIPFFLEAKFDGSDVVRIMTDEKYIFENPDPTIKRFVVANEHMFYLVHGDKDTPANVVKNLTMMFGEKPSAIIMSHRHHNAYDTQYGVKVIQNGSLVGTDRYCIDHRIAGNPEQMVIISNPDQCVECIYDIQLSQYVPQYLPM